LPEPTAEFLELARRTGVVHALMAGLHSDLVHEYDLRIDTLRWVSTLLGTAEAAVREDIDRFLAKLKEDHEAWHELEENYGQVQRAAVEGSDSLNDISERSLGISEKLRKSLQSRQEELTEIAKRIAKLSGSRIPPLPPKLIRPSRIATLIEALQRLAAGYARENLKP
jgi:hypothetical protein